MHAWANVARLTKARTQEGGLVARPAPGLSFLLREGMRVAFVPPRLDVPREGVVRSVRDVGGDHLVCFEGIDSRERAQGIVGCSCLVRRDDLPQGALDAQGPDVTGFELYDAQGCYVGTVSGAVPAPAQPLLQVECGKCAPALVPFADDLVVDVDRAAKRLTMDLPGGILDL